MAKITIEKVIVVSVSGANKAPISGDVRFSDGKYYGWCAHRGEVRFDTVRKMPAAVERFSFSSPKRAKLLTDWLNNNDWSVHVCKIS